MYSKTDNYWMLAAENNYSSEKSQPEKLKTWNLDINMNLPGSFYTTFAGSAQIDTSDFNTFYGLILADAYRFNYVLVFGISDDFDSQQVTIAVFGSTKDVEIFADYFIFDSITKRQLVFAMIKDYNRYAYYLFVSDFPFPYQVAKYGSY